MSLIVEPLSNLPHGSIFSEFGASSIPGAIQFFEILKRIWPRSTLLVSDIQQVVGQFNASLERNYVIIMDEALFSGDRRSQDRMKSLITEKSCHVEQKYQKWLRLSEQIYPKR